ncbi:hypothetical protein TH9_21930 [Thalassospira xiamenensis]|nr:hypothetical protein TH9_21930 [Thalassospira xiamenensis]
MIAFGNAGRSVTDGVKCARPAFIDRDWCASLCHRQMERAFGPLPLPEGIDFCCVDEGSLNVLIGLRGEHCFNIPDALIVVTEGRI